MAFSDEQRPEAQLGNQNRSSLNIKQPGENYWQDFFNNPENAVRSQHVVQPGRCIANNG